jgi:beta-mannosidase
VRRVLAPVAVWTTDEGLGGIDIHVANDRQEPLDVSLRVALYADLEHLVDEASESLKLAPRAMLTRNVEQLIGRFVDAAWTYRFGPPSHDAVVVSLEAHDGHLRSQAFRFPAGRPLRPEPADGLALEAAAHRRPDGSVELVVATRRLAYGVRVHAPGYRASEDAFCVEPGRRRTTVLTPCEDGASFSGGARAPATPGEPQ